MTDGKLSRRGVLGGLAQASITATLFGPALARATSTPAHNRTGTIADVEHVVILMQENRSFDHYFGTLSGVRGFADPRPAEAVWSQRGQEGRVVRPFRFDASNTRFPVMHSLAHDWESTHEAWNDGRHDQWAMTKSPLTMGYVTRAEIPYHFALADAFTVCDAYHASLLGSTCPNRLYLLTGSVDPQGRGGGPVIDNSDITQIAGGKVFGRGWVTYAERLQQAGIAWRAYRQGADPASDDNSDGGMNSLLAFEAFRTAKPGDPLHDRGVAPRRLEVLKQDVIRGRLAQVSWIFPPRIFCEHPNWPPAYGVEYIARVLDALTSNPEVWSKTVFLLMYDENDGFFDHMPPPAPPTGPAEGKSTVPVDEERHAVDGRPFGLGLRVPFIAISPWSRGGFVNSQLFDHTSVIRFLEARFGVHEPNISPWRRAVCGDLTSVFDFATPNALAPRALAPRDAFAPLPDQAAFELLKSSFTAKPQPAAPTHFDAPSVELGPRPARPLPYDLAVDDRHMASQVQLAFRNTGGAAAAFQVHDRLAPSAAPRRYTVEAGASLQDGWDLGEHGAYDLRVSGPNGFERQFRGANNGAQAAVRVRHRGDAGLAIEIANLGKTPISIRISDGYGGGERSLELAPGSNHGEPLPLDRTGGWYDLSFEGGGRFWRCCGHVETGRASITDPAIERTALALRSGDTFAS